MIQDGSVPLEEAIAIEQAQLAATFTIRAPDPEPVPIGEHYRFSYRGIKLDPYRIFCVYHITHPAQQHVIKKALRAGESVKTLRQDIKEIIASCKRWLEMLEEDEEGAL